MRADLREICQIEITRLKARQASQELSKDDVEKLQKLVSSLKTLEDSSTPESDDIGDLLRASSTEDLLKILDKID